MSRDYQPDNIVAAVDYGTTTTSVRLFQNGRVDNPLKSGDDVSIPSIVGMKKGKLVHMRESKGSGRIVLLKNVKQLNGKLKSDLEGVELSKEIFGEVVEFDEKDRPFFSMKTDEGSCSTTTRVYPQDVFRAIMEKVITEVNKKAGTEVKQYCFTIPNNTPDRTKRIMRKTISELGLECEFLIREPTAAGIHYVNSKSEHRVRERDKVLVFDFGGGTLDLTIMYRKGYNYEVIAQKGKPHLGGATIDTLLSDHIKREYVELCGHELIPLNTPEKKRINYMTKLLQSCREGKELLSSVESVEIELGDIGMAEEDDVRSITVSRSKFNEIIEPKIIKECRKAIREIMYMADVNSRQIGHVLLVGGSSKIPAIQAMFNGFNLLPVNDPQSVVVEGAMVASLDNITESYLTECMDCNIGCMVGDHFELHIPASTRIPTSVPYTYTLTTSSDSFSIDILREVDNGQYLKEGSVDLTNLPVDEDSFFCDIPIQLMISVSVDGTLSYEVRNNRTRELLASKNIILT